MTTSRLQTKQGSCLWHTRAGNRWLTAIVLLCSAGATAVYERLSRLLPSFAFHDDRFFHCPGCGGTRMLHSLLSGDWSKAFYYHPLFFLCLMAGMTFLGWFFLRTFTKDWKPLDISASSRWWLLIPGILVTFTLLRNTPLYQQFFY